jgi:hypothetical protein
MSSEFKIGRLRFNWKGSWNPSTVYSRDDVIGYQGKTYVCLLPHTAGSVFSNDLNFVTPQGASTPYWNLVIPGKKFIGQWATGQAYNLDNIVIQGGVVYLANTAHTSGVFNSQTSYWSQYTEFTDWISSGWQINTAYKKNQVVKYGAIVYKCITAHTSAATTALGLEENQSNWTIVDQSVDYKGGWSSGVRYKLNDLVKNGPDVWVSNSGHTSTNVFDQTKWSLWMPGFEYAGQWSSGTIYQPGATVLYGGYSYTSVTSNNTNNTPSTDAVNWALLNQGFNFRQEWTASNSYRVGDVITRHGVTFTATADNSSQDPTSISLSKTYTATGSSGTTLKLSSTTGIRVGMNVIGENFNAGQSVVSVVDSTTVQISQAPNTAPADGAVLALVGVNYIYWKILTPGTFWTKTWTLGQTYVVGDIAVWKNGTYVCVQNHVGTYFATSTITNVSTRPDTDLNNAYWVFFIPHARQNALTTIGDIETYSNGQYTAIPIGSTQLILRNTNNLPTWSSINIVPSVYYVSSSAGIDRPDYGVSLDQPWKTITYACNYIGNGQLYPNLRINLVANKSWILEELVAWVIYQKANNLNGFTSAYPFDQTKTRRDAGYIIDAIVYDLTRGGNSQIVAATQAYFQYGSNSQFYNTEVKADVPYYLPILNQLRVLILGGSSGSASGTVYQSAILIRQLANVEIDYTDKITALYSILITALTNANTFAIPLSNSGLTATIMVKTGDYPEILPIVIPANVAVNGDELRGVTVRPAVSYKEDCTATSSVTNLFTVYSTTGLANQTPVQFGDDNINTAIQFTSFGGVTTGKKYFVVGSTITSNGFGITSCTGTYSSVPSIGVSTTGSGATFSVSPTETGSYNVTLTNPGTGYTPGDTLKISGSNVGAVTLTTAGSFVIGVSYTILTVGTTDYTLIGASANSVGAVFTATDIGSGTGTANFNTNDISIVVTGISGAQPTGPITTFSKSGTCILKLTTGAGLISNSTQMLVLGGDCLNDMFRLRNGSGLRNLTVTGLKGTLTRQDEFSIQRPTGGAYACLDPGVGPNDTTAWIYRRSPYIQNVTAFGEGAVGLKIDGTLHNGGNKSLVCNDFTHILSNGIGIWCTGPGALTEAVSVFSYYGYCGYFAEDGGRIRATNGNTSYGTFGVIALGYDITETPTSGIIYNQSSQVQATVQSAFGSDSQLVRLTFSNAGSNYYTTTTNFLRYSNNFLGASWTSDGNLGFSKNTIAPSGLTEAWTLTSNSTTPATGYVYQNIAIPAAGASYTNIAGITLQGGGSGATFDVTVTSTSYVVTVNGGGTQYAAGNQIKILGSQLGGVDNDNDCTITAFSLSGSALLSVTSVGTVPVGSAFYYTTSVHVKRGTATNIDIQAIYSGSSTRTSAINYNFLTGVVTSYNELGGLIPTQYGVQNLEVSTTSPTSGWYRLWFASYDTTGLNTQLQVRIYSSSVTPTAGQYSYVYGGQVELSSTLYSPSFYLEVATTDQFTAYANFNVNGSGTGVNTIGEETRSSGIFQSRVTTDGLGFTGGTGYLTASNNAQGGNPHYIQLAQSETNTNSNYTGMRIFINSGTGAGQYAYISYYNASTKNAYVLKESFTSLAVTATTTATNLFTLGTGVPTTTLYVGQAVQFIPTYYSTTVGSTNLSTLTVTASTGGNTNTLTVSSNALLKVNTAVTFTTSGLNATTFGGVSVGFTYYVFALVGSTGIKLSAQIFGTELPLNNGIGTMIMNFSSENSYIQASTSNMVVNYPIQFTGTALGGLAVGTTYYINNIVDISNFTISATVINITVTATANTGGGNWLTTTSTTGLTPLNPIIFAATTTGTVVEGTQYFISKINPANTTQFKIASSQLVLTATETSFGSNLIATSSTVAFVTDNPIIFTGITFGNIVAEQVYYILASNANGTNTAFTISTTPGGNAVGLQNGTGSMTFRTCPAPFATSGSSGASMPGTTTGPKKIVTLGVGAMNGTFSTNLFGGPTIGTDYYISSLDSVNRQFKLTTSLGGSELALSTKTGSMNLAEVGWDHVNIGTPPANLIDSSTTYFIEPRLTFPTPEFTQASANAVVALSNGNWKDMAYGDNYWLAIPDAGNKGARSTNGSNWTQITLPDSLSWTSIAYGAGRWIAVNSVVSAGNSVAAVSKSNGLGWRTYALPSNTTWKSIAYGNGRFVVIAGDSSSAAYSTNYGVTWTASTLPLSLSWQKISYGNGKFVAISSTGNTAGVGSISGNGTTVTITYTIEVDGMSQPITRTVNPFVVGQKIVISGCSVVGYNGTFTVTSVNTTSVSFANSITTSGNTGGAILGNSIVAYSTNGSSWTSSSLPSSSTWVDVAFGSGQFVAVSTSSTKSAYSFDGQTWYSSNDSMVGDRIAYGQGVFLALTSGSTQAYVSEGGAAWSIKTITASSVGAMAFGYAQTTYDGYFSVLSGTSLGSTIVAGCRAKGRPAVTSGIITSINMIEAGSGYTNTISSPGLVVTDPNVTINVQVNNRRSNGVLGNPTFYDRGNGYNSNSTTVNITGNGFADQYQTGLQVILNNLTRLPSPGDNLTIAGVNEIFKVTSAYSVFNTQVPNLQANVSVSPDISVANSTANGTAVSIRSKYSQARLTGHDFLNIGYGDFITSNYPGFPVDGYVAQQEDQSVEANFGRVFFTSTDQDGNFKVGNLFGVQQATGIVTLSASQFGLSGLETLSLGGISVGGNSTVITQFSTDAAFTQNSDSVIPTQKAIRAYISGRLSQGGSNTYTGQLTAGSTVVGSPNLIRSSVPNGVSGSVIKMTSKVNFIGEFAGVDGNIAALDFFKRSWNKQR